VNNNIITLSITSLLALTGCNKTEQPNATDTNITDEMEVEVEIDGEMLIMVNGEEVDVMPSDMMQHVMHMIESEGGERPMEMRMMHMNSKHGGKHGKHGGSHPEMREHMMHMMHGHGGEHGEHGGHGDLPPEMREHMMQMMHGHGGEHGNHSGMHGPPPNPHEMCGEWHPHHNERNVPEVIQFMQELGMLGEVAAHLEEGQSVALLGIHMIRDNLEGDLQIDSLTAIVEEAASGSPARNAALIVAIQALQDAGDDEAAAELMVELVLSN
jgi:hypothetical protein